MEQKVGVVGAQCLARASKGGSGPCEVKEGVNDGVIEVFGGGLCWAQPAKVMLCNFLSSNAAHTLRGMLEYLLGLLCCVLREVEGDGVAPWW